MKANEAPERIWIDNLDEGFWFESPAGNKSVEYTRTDVFIDKACEWLKENLWKVANDLTDKEDKDRFIKEFCKAMEE